jgi:hypothetical protein
MRRRWILSLVVALGAVGAVIGASAVSADFRGGVHGGEVLDRVASILGMDRSELDDAFTQARSELKDEKQAETLAALVDNGTLTGDEALAIDNWLEQRPEALDGIKPDKRSVFKFHGGSLDHSGSSLNIPSFSPEYLDRLVEAGTLSQEDADAIQEWLDARPESADKLLSNPLRAFEGFAPFGGGGFFQFDGDRETLDLEGLRERLEQFRNDLDLEDGFPEFNLPEGGFFQFDGEGFDFEFEGNGPGFFFRGGPRGHSFGGHGGFPRFHDFTPDTTNDPEPVNL